jgi:hypothetical protein
MLRALIVFVVVLVLLVILIGTAGVVGPYELLLAVLVSFAIAFAARPRRRLTH